MSLILFALAVAAVLYFSLEFFAMSKGTFEVSKNHDPNRNSIVGSTGSVVSIDSTKTSDDQWTGRVLVNGESWKATLDADSDNRPSIDDKVTVVSVDNANLTIVVKYQST